MALLQLHEKSEGLVQAPEGLFSLGICVEYSYATIVMDDSRPSKINYAGEMPSGTGNIKQVAEPSETPGYRNKKEEQWKDRSSGDSSKESSERSSQ